MNHQSDSIYILINNGIMKCWRMGLIFISMSLTFLPSQAQTKLTPNLSATERQALSTLSDDDRESRFSSDSISLEGVPEGIRAWKIDKRFGTILQADYDTIPHLFPQEALTGGVDGRYNFLGNLGSPRISRISSDFDYSSFNDGQFLFAQPYSFFLKEPNEVLFTNTRSPFTNITYHECGNKQNGEDRIRALFSTNVNKDLGLGFKLDYLYGRGYYDSQSTALFNAMLFGSYVGERYQLHSYFSANHTKMSENGGLENDDYVKKPESFPTSYGMEDMPMNLQKTYNKMNINTFYLTHNYNLGFVKKTLKPEVTERIEQEAKKENPAFTLDSVQASDYNYQFVPTTSLFHTLRFDTDNRRFLSNASSAIQKGYFQDFVIPVDSAYDQTKYLHIDNTVGFELKEGLNSWMKTGVRLFARHEYYRIVIPDTLSTGELSSSKFNEHLFSVGGQLIRQEGKRLNYMLLGEVRTSGKTWGEFNIEGNATLRTRLLKDTITLALDGYVRRERPNAFLRNFHSTFAWWDKSFDQQLTASVRASFVYKGYRIGFHAANVQNYVYLKEVRTPYSGSDGIERATYGLSVEQNSGSVQMLGMTLEKSFTWGPLSWENKLTLQTTSDRNVLPLPAFNAWTNLFLRFTIAHELRTEVGADMTFFTRYYAPAYSPVIGNFAVQDPSSRIYIGNYPIINAYLNFHLKRTRFYIMASHVNSSNGSGNPFLVPHYPINRLVLRLGISWNFVN